MSGWTCPHQIEDDCQRLNKPCDPAQKGCILQGKVIMVSSPEDKSERCDKTANRHRKSAK